MNIKKYIFFLCILNATIYPVQAKIIQLLQKTFQPIVTPRIQAHFNPHILPKILESIESTKKDETIRIAMYALSNKKICNAIKEAADRGFYSKIIVDPYSFSIKNSPLLSMSHPYIHLFIFKPKKNKSAILHNKFFIFNKKFVLTGSSNATDKFPDNIENILEIYDPNIVNQYFNEHEKIKSNAISFEFKS